MSVRLHFTRLQGISPPSLMAAGGRVKNANSPGGIPLPAPGNEGGAHRAPGRFSSSRAGNSINFVLHLLVGGLFFLVVPLLAHGSTVSNTGTVTPTNVVVLGNLSANHQVFTAASPAPVALVRIAGSFVASTNFPDLSASIATRRAIFRVAVTNSVTSTCLVTTTPLLTVTQNCPTTPVTPGSLLTYSGTVSNAGNITLQNVVVTNSQSGTTPLVSLATLAPGATAAFSGSYTAPATGPTVSVSTALATSLCGVSVASSAASSCAIITAPGLAVSVLCPVSPSAPGGTMIFTGSVTNTGNVTLTNVAVVGSLPALNTPVLGPITLAPGSATNFTVGYLVPLNICSVSETLTATGNDSNTGLATTNASSAICPLLTAPLLAVTQTCPATPVTPGSMLTYSGTVSNAGNITLQNVVVTNSQSGTTPLVSLPTLAPGATASFSGSYTAPATGPTVSVSTALATSLCGVSVASSVSSSCAIITAPGLAVSVLCPVSPSVPGGTMIFTGSVSNTGNVTLTNVAVVGSQPAPNTPVLGPITLAPGSATNFTVGYLVPLNICSVSETLTATGNDSNTGLATTNASSAICPLLTAPLLAVTQNCPASPVTPGSLLTYSGTVSNAGNITLQNVVVTNSQSGTTPLVSIASLDPGASAIFSGSYTAPATGPTVSVSTALATSLCGVSVASSAASSCAIITTPGLAVTKLCPSLPVAPGEIFIFGGTVTNTGNVTLVNVVVVDSQPVPNTPVIGPITLEPGEGTNFTVSYLVPLNVCSVTDTLTATANDSSTGLESTNPASAECAVLTTPGITVTETCPSGKVTAGTMVSFGGLVSNTGNVSLTDIYVYSSGSSNGAPVLGPISLAPGDSAPFAGEYVATGGSDPTNSVTIATNSSGSITTNLISVVTTNITFSITTNLATPAMLATINPLNKAVGSQFSVPPGLKGLTYDGADAGYGASELYSMRQASSSAAFFDTIAPATATTTDQFSAGNDMFDSLTYAADDLGYGPLLFYYLRHDIGGVSTFGSITPGGVVGVTADRFVVGSNFDALTYTATDVGYGANLFYYIRHDASGLSTFGTINPALPGTITDRFTVGASITAIVFTPLSAPGYGANNFYYLRQSPQGVSTFGTILVTGATTGNVTDRFVAGTNMAELTFTAADLGFGPNLFYTFSGGASGLATNAVTTFTTNILTTFTTNQILSYLTNTVTSFTATNTVTAGGIDICQARTAAAAANCLGFVPTPLDLAQALKLPVVGALAPANGAFKLSFPAQDGKSYTVQYKNNLTDPVWTTLETLVGRGGSVNITDQDAGRERTRFYRVIPAQ